MPHKTTTLETGEKVVSKCLLSSWRWKDTLPKLNIVNAQLGLKKVSASGLSRIQTTHSQITLQRVKETTLLDVVNVTG
jgi:hypothetical protein